ncbi:hypothetical protein KQI77_12460 [Clostridium sp. MSJ-8]|uniref:hypothetical protein n=1 Tax=Clostridium sp. MSJ-8 TaxID=2841510 RepID=UPI001C0E97D7|nr:hypothetical protein [Clostridium sp. MSJ-8]MBU5488940.1 hypothetical protein [Clostridium sp. MSJ-8]
MANPYELIAKIQQRMQDPVFASQFNSLIQKLNSIPGLQQEVMRIAKIEDPNKRQKAINRLPPKVKSTVEEMMRLLNS